MKNYPLHIYTVVLVCMLALFPFFWVSFKFFIFNYGWWPTFNFLRNNGLEMYKDFNTVYPPAYTYFLSLFDAWATSPATSLKFGIARCYLLFGLLVYFFSRFTSLGFAALGAFLVVFAQAKSVVFMPDDYHVFQRTVFVLILLLLWFFLAAKQKAQQIGFAICLGVVGGYLLFAKQNVGLLTSFGVMLALIRGAVCKHHGWAIVPIFALVFVASVQLFLLLFSMDWDTLHSITFGNDSKGGLLTVATNIISNVQNSRLILAGLLLTPLSLGVYFWWAELREVNVTKIIGRLPEWFVAAVILTVATLALFVLLKKFTIVINVLAIWFIIIGTFLSFMSKHRIFSYIYPFGGLIYANSMTSGLVDETLVLITVPVLLYCLGMVETQISDKFRKVFLLCGATVVIALATQGASKKFNVPYDWWGYKTAPLMESVFIPPYEQLAGLTVDAETYQILEKIKANVERHAQDQKSVYFYPHMAFFYIMHDKLPPTKNPVQWFDVITNAQMADETNYLTNDGPDLLVMFDASNGAYEGHRNMKKSLPQLDFLRHVNQLIHGGKYKPVEYQIYKRGIENILRHGMLENVQIIVSNDEFVGRNVADIFTTVLPERLRKEVRTLSVIRSDQSGYTNTGAEALNQIVDHGLTLQVTATPEVVEHLVKRVGYVTKAFESWYTLKILVKQ